MEDRLTKAIDFFRKFDNKSNTKICQKSVLKFCDLVEVYIGDRRSATVEDAKELLEPYKYLYNAAHKLWITRQQFAYEMGNFFQIPTSIGSLYRLTRIGLIHYYVILTRLPILWWFRIFPPKKKSTNESATSN